MSKRRTSHRFRHLGPLLSVITLCAALLSASEAQAAPVSCTDFLAPFVTWANGYDHVEAAITSNQAGDPQQGWNGLVSASVNSGGRAKMKTSYGYLTNAISDWRVAPGQWIFSDRVSGSQPFFAGWPDAIDVYIAYDGSAAYIYSHPWNSWITISPLTCDEGLIYGFGNGIVFGRALYVIALNKQPDIN